ncbi:MAG: AMP-binding enzyme family protein [Rhizobacter sp.]|nr:AMP-binding enzyme family protein [Rhizobacter sp.]
MDLSSIERGPRPLLRTQADLHALEATPIDERLTGLTSTFDVMRHAARHWPDLTAITYLADGDPAATPLDITYAQLHARVAQAGNLFASLGLERDDCVAYLLPNVPQAHVCIWGAQAVCRVAGINHFLEPSHIEDLLVTLGAKVLVTSAPSADPALWAKLAPLVAKLPQLRMTFVVGADGASLADHERVADFDLALDAQPLAPRFAAPRSGHDIAACFHTGGTTGTPKIVQLTHRSTLANAWMIGEMMDYTPEDVVVCGLPLFHVNGVVVTGLAPFMFGSHTLMAGVSGFRNPRLIGNFWKLVERYRVTTFSGVPTVYAALLNVPIEGADVSSLRFGICGAAPMPIELFNRFERATGIRILEGYGMTETTATACVNPRDGERRIGSIGLPAPYTRMKAVILDEEGGYVRDAAVDEIGNVAIFGPQLTIGYMNPKHNAGLWLPGGWLNSGDLGRQDADGYIWLAGRAKDLIIRGGHNIDPGLIEEALSRHPEVETVAAVGRPDAYAGEMPVAYVKLRTGAKATPDELKAFARAHVTERAAAPDWVEAIPTMPTTAVGKIFKPDLRKRAIERAVTELLAAQGVTAKVRAEDDARHGVVAVVSVEDDAAHTKAAEVCGALAVHVRFSVRDSNRSPSAS